jgi:hypothetical protein
MEKTEPEKFFNIIFNSNADDVFTTDGEGRITFLIRRLRRSPDFSAKRPLGVLLRDLQNKYLSIPLCSERGLKNRGGNHQSPRHHPEQKRELVSSIDETVPFF